MKLIKAELTVGAVVGITFAVKVGWWAVPLAVVTSLLWAMGGADGGNKLYRRLGVPLIVSTVVGIVQYSLIPFICIPLVFGILSIGYGIPSTQPPDEGSWLGQLAYRYAAHNEKKAEAYCRTIIYALLILAFLPCWIS